MHFHRRSLTTSGRAGLAVVAVLLMLSASPAGAQPTDPRCDVPGVLVTADPAGDTNASAPGATEVFDILSVHLAESYPGGNGELAFTMTVSEIPDTLPANGTWRMSFDGTHADASTTQYFVTMTTNSSANPAGVSFNFGFLDTSGATNINRTVGGADGGALDAATGQITVFLKTNKIKKPVGETLTGTPVDLSAGNGLTNVGGNTSVLLGVLGNGFTINVDATDTTGGYSVAGPVICPPDIIDPPPPTAATVRYQIYEPPNGLATTAGEPTVGTNWQTGRAIFQSGLQTLRVSFDDCTSPAAHLWEDISPVTSSATSLDPLVWTDHFRAPGDDTPNRTIVSQLAGVTSLSSLSDDDGQLWVPNQGAGIASGIDHQGIGGGPFAAPVPPNPTYPNAVYYCSQDLVNALCALSVDGGLTYGPAVPIYQQDSCTGLHGHPKVAPDDGTVYVPNKSCGPQNEAAVVRSEDNGITWHVRTVPDSGTTGHLVDPSVGIGEHGTLYLGYQNSDGHAWVAVSPDKGDTWLHHQDVGAVAGVEASVFPAVVAGDDDRAAYAFLGSTTPGDSADESYPGDFGLYVAHTFDGGETWEVQNVTGTDPVQRGSICTLGTTACSGPPAGSRTKPDRNLLDFFDAEVDHQGRVLVSYADGCVTADCIAGGSNDFTEQGVLARQSGGRRLFRLYDPADPDVPGAPLVTAIRDSGGVVVLSWPEPDNGGSAIVDYNVYARDEGEATAQFLANTGGDRSFEDVNADPAVVTFYTVTAVNARGESATCSEVRPIDFADPCVIPGVPLLTDPPDDAIPNEPALDILELHLAEPAEAGSPAQLVFTLRVKDLSVIPPNHQWYIIWDFENELRKYVAAISDATGAVAFEYGEVSPPLSTGDPDPDFNRPIPLGAADYGVIDTVAGTFTIAVSKTNVGDPQPGQTLLSVSPRSFAGNGTANISELSTADSTAIKPSYVIAGNCVAGSPIARGDAATTVENTAVVIDVLQNDSDNGNPPLTVTAVTQPAHGAVEQNPDQTLTYTPDENFNSFGEGPDVFTYTITNGTGNSAVATVTVNVTPFCGFTPTGTFFDDFEPQAEPGWTVDTAVNNLPTSLTWQVTADTFAHSLTNSFFTDASTLDTKDDRLLLPPQDLSTASHLIFWHRFQTEDGFDGGVLEISNDGGASWVDVLDGGGLFVEGGYNDSINQDFNSLIAGRQAWTGASQFVNAQNRVEVNIGAFAGTGVLIRLRYVADPLVPGAIAGTGWWIDDVEVSNTLELEDCNRPPLARADSAATQEDSVAVIPVLLNDSDPDGDPISIVSFTQPANGLVTDNGDGTLTYTPNANFHSPPDESFQYTITDGEYEVSAGVTVVVHQVNDAPIAGDDHASTRENQAVVIDVLANDSDPDGDPLMVTAVSDPPNGSAALNGDGTVTYTPDPGFFSPPDDTFTYTITDGEFEVDATVTVTVERGNQDPVAQDDAATTEESTPVVINVLANDSDPDGDDVFITAVGMPTGGTATDNGDGTVTYSPAMGFSGSDSFTYDIADGNGGTATATVNVIVNRKPQVGNQKVTGGGWIDDGGDKANFGFNAQRKDGTVKGRISYHGGGDKIRGTVTQLSVLATTASFGGSCTLESGAPCTFAVDVEDNGEPGANDRFAIRIYDATGALVHDNDGRLGGGNIQIH